MENININETKELITEFVKVNSLLIKLNKNIRNHLSDKSILLDKEDYEERYEIKNSSIEVQQYAYLRKTISTIHDKIFETLRTMNCEDRKAILDYIENKSKNYEAELEEVEEKVKMFNNALTNEELPDNHKLRIVFIEQINESASRKEDLQGYLISYYGLTHYIEALNLASNIKKGKN